MTESPFAPSRCYLLGSRVVHGLDQRYPVLIATTGPCVRPRFSVSLCHRLCSTVFAGCCEPLLHLGLSQRYSADLSSDPWTPTTVADRVHLPVTSPVTSAFPKTSLGRLNHNTPLNDFRADDTYAAAVIR